MSLFAGISGTTEAAAEVAAQIPTMKALMQEGLQYTLAERDQASKWAQPLTQLLVYIALNAQQEVEEKVADVLGEVVRTDARRLEDLRTTMETDGAEVMVLTEAIRRIAGVVH